MELIGKQAPFYLYRDTQTGVEYFVFCDTTSYGYGTGKGAAMCPRYNADGTLCVHKKDGE